MSPSADFAVATCANVTSSPSYLPPHITTERITSHRFLDSRPGTTRGDFFSSYP
ncbi:MAG: hypothetical protein II766_03740 [Paludibacteraceae bacterium]|nr:hypothetical protein [Paludibacteraceae bacterium]